MPELPFDEGCETLATAEFTVVAVKGNEIQLKITKTTKWNQKTEKWETKDELVTLPKNVPVTMTIADANGHANGIVAFELSDFAPDHP